MMTRGATMRLRGTMRVNEAGRLEIGGCDTVELAERFGTPLYLLDEAAFTARVAELAAAFQAAYPGEVALVYAGKAFLTVGFARLLASLGLWLDVASGGELYTAKAAGFPPERLLVHGNNKSDEELRMSLEGGAGRLVVDNLPELRRLIRLAQGKAVQTRLLLRIRPGIPVHTHNHMQTGQEDSKFGLGPDEITQAVSLLRDAPHLRLVGLHAHLGSQLHDPEPYRRLAEGMVAWLERVGELYGQPLTELDVEGGWAGAGGGALRPAPGRAGGGGRGGRRLPGGGSGAAHRPVGGGRGNGRSGGGRRPGDALAEASGGAGPDRHRPRRHHPLPGG